MTVGSAQELTVTSQHGKLLTLSFTAAILFIKQQETQAKIPIRQVIGAYYSETSLEVYFLSKGKRNFSLAKVEGKAKDTNNAENWSNALMDAAYQGVKRCRKLKVLINPFGGKAKARSIFNNIVEPIFRAANCSLDVTYTTHHKHAVEIAKELCLDYDVLVILSGDGLVHEALNGFALHAQSAQAFKIPVAPIPTGSANATSLNLLGLEDGFDVSAAALNVIKGRPMKIDLFAFTQGDTRVISFMSQALGLMAELDTGTDNWRWMGDTRFFLGFLRGLIAFKSCPVTLQIKVAEQDKSKIVEALRLKHSGKTIDAQSASESSLEEFIPPLTQAVDEKDGWITYDQPMLYISAGQGPYISRDLMQFPVSLPEDGFIDIAVQDLTHRLDILKWVTDDIGPTGQTFWKDSQHYFKATAYRVRPQTSKGYVTVDGEAFPLEDFQVEVLKGLGTLMSPYGHYAADLLRDGKNL